MDRAKFWNDACRGGAIIGLVMAASNVAEQAIMYKGGSIALIALMVLEWLAMAGVFIWLLYRFTRKHSTQYSPEEGFSYGQGLGFSVVMSLLSGLIVGAAGYFYRYVLIGNDRYTERLIDTIRGLYAQMPSMPADLEDAYETMFEQLRALPEPSIFRAVLSSMFVYFVVGGLIGLIVAGVLTRAPRPFAGSDGQ